MINSHLELGPPVFTPIKDRDFDQALLFGFLNLGLSMVCKRRGDLNKLDPLARSVLCMYARRPALVPGIHVCKMGKFGFPYFHYFSMRWPLL